MQQTPQINIETLIYLIRNQRVMLDYDLAKLYGVKTKVLNQAVARSIGRFPPDFMFQLTEIERQNLMRSQIVTASGRKSNLRFHPFVFTEMGIAMLSGVLKSAQAIEVHISIIRVFFKLREALREQNEFSIKLENIERNSNQLFKVIFERLDQQEVTEPLPVKPKRRIGI